MRTARGNELESIHGAGKKTEIRWGGRRWYGERKGFLWHGIVATQGPRPEGLAVRRVLAGGRGRRG